MLAFLDAAPLLEEESSTCNLAGLMNSLDPFFLHWPGSGTAFAADDYPVNPAQVEFAEILEQRFDAEEARAGGGVS